MAARPAAGPDMVTETLVALLESGAERVLLIDSRPFVDYNTAHILEAVNINCSKLMKRRLQQDKVQVTELIQHSAKHKVEVDPDQKVVVYDHSSQDVASLSADCFLTVLLGKLEKSFRSVHLLAGGFAEFSRCFPGLCEGKSALVPSCISQPCLPVASAGPTRILTHLFLGCQRDVLNKELMQQNGIGFVLNASNTCPKPDFIPESHFLRVPVNDSFCETILPWLDRSVEFIEKAKACNGCVLVHCLAGISRSATIAIAYIMKRMDVSLDEAYRFVKEKRPTISPNFNFLGQLLDYERKIQSQAGALGPRSKLQLRHLERASEAGSRAGATPDPTPASEPGGGPAGGGEDRDADAALLEGVNGLRVASDRLEDSNKLKRSFSLDIKSVSGTSGSRHGSFSSSSSSSSEAVAPYKPPGALEGSGKLGQFSPVQEVSEQTPESSPDKEEAGPSARPPESRDVRGPPSPRPAPTPLHRSGSVEDNYRSGGTLGFHGSRQPPASSVAGRGLESWDPQGPPPAASGWYFAPEPSRFCSASALYRGGSAYSCGQLSGGGGGGDPALAVRRRPKPRDRADSRRSWHEESSFEKQFKRRSCQMEFGESILADSRAREELGAGGGQASFSGSMEIIEVS
ncbi:dual specificity protein phosphatase 16 [Tachyglossus aculeatus]|uniref:dual specificity protein phosphatase 16 n=1 Tax=Tachyglossus aculeatus TaxID=9261 RepID=UPI0018F4AC80|nr:dual specificity protein phosphatase 16 [Tachyglossus aculeatus]